ncbi:MAG: 50S ribosomal protein L9 [Candidatus Nanopelagicales bacterium]|nr:50S ribosomal protein L9 [Candidatus Nanopelagicales bacterium]MDZ4250725.1 50S ribosomal protein L9 [Candidatus Nanopelagicales bacterium]
MKLILTKEVDSLGSAGDVVDVKDGYGRNYLVPQGMAIAWTKGGEKQISQIRRSREVREIRDKDRAEEVKSELSRLSVRVSVRSGQGGQLFGRVTEKDLAGAIRAAGGPDIDRGIVHVPDPIKHVGAHLIEIRLHPEVSAELSVEVVSE